MRYHDVHGDTVKAFCQENEHEIAFYCWMQWVASEQLAECFAHSKQLGMPIGLYRDMAVGVAQGGAETWDERRLYCLAAAIGAPPDPLWPQGQNWSLPPMNPLVMQAQGYQPFIDVLRSNMAHCGALRIDHVMGLLRLWWIPKAELATHGAYVHYPLDDLLAVLALESQRQRCLVVGEDLGTVPAEIVDKLLDSGVYSYKVLFLNRMSTITFGLHSTIRASRWRLLPHTICPRCAAFGKTSICHWAKNWAFIPMNARCSSRWNSVTTPSRACWMRCISISYYRSAYGAMRR